MVLTVSSFKIGGAILPMDALAHLRGAVGLTRQNATAMAHTLRDITHAIDVYIPEKAKQDIGDLLSELKGRGLVKHLKEAAAAFASQGVPPNVFNTAFSAVTNEKPGSSEKTDEQGSLSLAALGKAFMRLGMSVPGSYARIGSRLTGYFYLSPLHKLLTDAVKHLKTKNTSGDLYVATICSLIARDGLPKVERPREVINSVGIKSNGYGMDVKTDSSGLVVLSTDSLNSSLLSGLPGRVLPYRPVGLPSGRGQIVMLDKSFTYPKSVYIVMRDGAEMADEKTIRRRIEALVERRFRTGDARAFDDVRKFWIEDMENSEREYVELPDVEHRGFDAIKNRSKKDRSETDFIVRNPMDPDIQFRQAALAYLVRGGYFSKWRWPEKFINSVKDMFFLSTFEDFGAMTFIAPSLNPGLVTGYKLVPHEEGKKTVTGFPVPMDNDQPLFEIEGKPIKVFEEAFDPPDSYAVVTAELRPL